jgi:uncharacterized protein (DUF111 family)
VVDLFLDVRRGATVEAVLGALIEAGASLETIDAAVATLGRGDVRLQVQAAAAGSVLRIRAPHGAPAHETWQDLRPRVALLALDEAVTDRALAVLDALFAARSSVHGVEPEEVDVDPLAGPDDLADAVALAAALHSLEVAELRATAVGHGTGTMRTVEGEVQLPGAVVGALLAGRPTTRHDVQRELVDPVGAALLATLTAPGGDLPGADEVAARGHGRLPDGSSVEALVLHPATTAGRA